MQGKWQDKIPTRSHKTLIETPSGDDEGFGTIVLVSGFDMAQQPQWAYALIPGDKYLAFKEAEEKGNYSLSDFGRVLHFGAGAEPPAEIKQEMQEKYGCEEDFEDQIERMMLDAINEIPELAELFGLEELKTAQ